MTRRLTAMAIGVASLVGISWALYHLIRTGSCATGGPYVVARQCPSETWAWVLALLGGIFGTLIAAGAYPGKGLAGAIFGLLPAFIGASALLAAFGPAAPHETDLKIFGALFGGCFLAAGLGLGLLVPAGRRRARRAEWLVTHGRRAPATVVAVEDTGVTINDNPRLRMTFRVEPEGEEPFTAEKAATVPRTAIPRLGDRAVFFWDPNDTERNAASFDAKAFEAL